MSADNRSVHTDALATLGTIINETEARDAIHLAVEPVIAGERLMPGEHVTLRNGEAFGAAINCGLGIVDPFLEKDIPQGARFWLVVYPRQITSLRHVWEHPSFPSAEVASGALKGDNKSASEAWMRRWAVEHVGYDYYGDGDKLSEDAAYAFAVQAGREEHIGPYEDARDYIDNEWWDHWEAITGERGNRNAYFSCGC